MGQIKNIKLHIVTDIKLWLKMGDTEVLQQQNQPHLSKQDLNNLDTSTLNPLTPEVISRQAINIGTIGHVAHGKSTVVKAISGVHTVRFKKLERNITIRLGYANAKLYVIDTESLDEEHKNVDVLAE